VKELIEAFRALKTAPRALWIVIFAFSLDAMAYFGILPLMKPYLGQDIGIDPKWASVWVSVFTGSLTFVMLFVGKLSDKLGARRGMNLALWIVIGGRVLFGLAPFAGAHVTAMITVAVSLLIVALGEGIMQPVAYAGVKAYTNEKTGPMGYAMLYAIMNLAAGLVGPLSASVRTSWDAKKAAGTSALSGFNAVNWACTGITLLTALLFFAFMTKRAEAAKVASAEEHKGGYREAATTEEAEEARAKEKAAKEKAAKEKAAKEGSPLRNVRFLFFIFMLLPVRTLFAHQWLTMPEYVLRSYSQDVADKMEWLVDSMNPLIIFLAVPTITAVTKRFHVYTMMIAGTAVSALSTFLLCGGPRTSMLILYFFVFSIGEALWSARFLEYAANLAPEGRVAQYMGIANFPWFIAKTTTGFYSGFILERFCPKDGPQSTETMWLIYGAIATITPVGLVLARRWVMKGMHAPAAAS